MTNNADKARTWELIAIERRRLADELTTLSDEQWRTPSQCDAWTVEDVAAHLILPFEVGNARFGWKMLRHRGNLDRVMIDLTAWVGSNNSRDELVAKLRHNAESRWTPPGSGPEIPLTEVIVHGQDIRRAIGAEHAIPADTIEFALKGLTDEELRSDYAERIGFTIPEGNQP